MKNFTMTTDVARRIVEEGTPSALVAAQYFERPTEESAPEAERTVYLPGEGIAIESSVVSNTGLLSAGVGNGATRSGELKFNEQHFEWGASNVSGVYGICVKSTLFPAPNLSASVSGNAITITLEV